jgi:hypothetical protein
MAQRQLYGPLLQKEKLDLTLLLTDNRIMSKAKE